MTREEAIQRIDKMIAYMNSLDADEEEQKDTEALYKAIQALQALQEKKIVWHPYPKEKPKKDGTYLVTMKYEDDEESCVITSNFIETYDSFCGGRFISAWAELPKPYEEGAEE